MQIAVNASRFSLRVMEAMRSLQQYEDDTLPTSSVEDIVDYIEANYRDDGDLYAQVRTALKQIRHGIAGERVPLDRARRHLDESYHLLQRPRRLPAVFSGEDSSQTAETRQP